MLKCDGFHVFFPLFTVRVAAEAILKGENPIPAQGDNTGKKLC